MNIRSKSALEEALIRRLKELLASIVWLQGNSIQRLPTRKHNPFDLKLSVPLGKGGMAEVMILCRTEVRPSLFPYVTLPKDFKKPKSGLSRYPVLAAPYISPRMAGVCAQSGWGWFDLAGNCRLSVPGIVHIEKSGNEPVHQPPKSGTNLGTNQTSRIIRTLLTPENAGERWTQAELGKESYPAVSVGLVNKVVRFLMDEKYLDQAPDAGFRLHDPLGLLNAWAGAYRFDRHVRRDYFTLMDADRLRDTLAVLGVESGNHAAYASFSAAEVQAPHVRQPKIWLYLDPEYEERFATMTEAKPVDSGENLIVLLPSDKGVFYHVEEAPGRLGCTNTVQTYVDLVHSGGRGKEAAEAVLEQRLKKAWKAQGLLNGA